MRQMRQKWLCFYSIVRFVPYPLRNEARNVGVIVLCPDYHFGGIRYRLDRSGLRSDSTTYRFLQQQLASYNSSLPGIVQSASQSLWTKDQLQELHEESTNIIQFTAPMPALGDPIQLLEDLQREFVAPPHRTNGEKHRHAVERVKTALQREMSLIGKTEWVRTEPKIEVHGLPYRFDLAVQNGRLYYTVNALTCRPRDLQHVEAIGTWYSRVWRDIASETGASGVVVMIDDALKPGPVQDRCRDVADWIRDVGVRVAHADEVDDVAKEIAWSLH